MNSSSVKSFLSHAAAGSCRGRCSFTLVELLIVVVITAGVTAVIASCLFGGIRIWASAKDMNTVDLDATVFLEVLEKDVMNSFRFRTIPFRGDESSMQFPCLLRMSGAVGQTEERVGTVNYRFDADRGVISVGKWKYPETEAANAASDALISAVENVSFSYCASAGDSKESAWKQEWKSEGARPAGVRVALKLRSGPRTRYVTRTIYLRGT